MAKKAAPVEERINLIEIFSDFKESKNIDRNTMINVIVDSFRNVIAKLYGTDEQYDVITALPSHFLKSIFLW